MRRWNKRVIYLFDIYDIVALFKIAKWNKRVIYLFDIYDIVALFKMQEAIKELLIYTIYMI